MSIWHNSLILLAFVFLLSPNQNCSQNSDVSFQSQSNIQLSRNQESQAGNGEGFLGKPEEGTYTRTFYDYSCNATNVTTGTGIQGTLEVKNIVDILTDSCADKDYTFLFTDKILDFSYYNKDYLGVGAAGYERTGSTAVNEPPIVDAWCRAKFGSDGFDVVLKSNHAAENPKAKIYFGLNGIPRFVPLTDVTKSSSGSRLTYQSQSIYLEIQKSNSSAQLSPGQVTALIDGKTYTYQMNCHVADQAPIEEMGVGLTTMTAFNVFTTNTQESVCAHPGILECENYEDRVNTADLTRVKFANSGWSLSNPNSFTVSNLNGFDGAKSLQANFGADGTGSGTKDFSFPQLSNEVFVRFYIKFSANFVFSPISQTLGGYYSTGANGASLYVDGNGVPVLSTYDGVNLYTNRSNLGAINNPQNWHCIETRVQNGDGTGEIQLWVDNVPAAFQSNLRLINPYYAYQVQSTWSCPNTINVNFCDTTGSHPVQNFWVDNIVVATQRIGCF